jgi:hypothetical protein
MFWNSITRFEVSRVLTVRSAYELKVFSILNACSDIKSNLLLRNEETSKYSRYTKEILLYDTPNRENKLHYNETMKYSVRILGLFTR